MVPHSVPGTEKVFNKSKCSYPLRRFTRKGTYCLPITPRIEPQLLAVACDPRGLVPASLSRLVPSPSPPSSPFSVFCIPQAPSLLRTPAAVSLSADPVPCLCWTCCASLCPPSVSIYFLLTGALRREGEEFCPHDKVS